MSDLSSDKNKQNNLMTDLERDIVNNKDLNFIFENICEEISVKEDIKTIKNKEISSFIKHENLIMAEEIIKNDEMFNQLSNEYKMVLADVLINHKHESQEYINKIIQTSDHDLVLLIARNKKIYHSLNRENKLIINEKLAKNPWLTSETIRKAVTQENEKKFRTETMRFLFDTKKIMNPLDLLTEM